MLRLFQWLFVGHVHKWKTISSEAVSYDYEFIVAKKGQGVRFIQQCEHCGIVKKIDLI